MMAGVGGQGTILASKVLAGAAEKAGYDIKVSEIHGMAQRGGSVVTQVRLGQKVYSPLIGEKTADVILAFEKLEGLRLLPYLRPGGTMIINDQAIPPAPVLAGAAVYPADVIAYIKGTVPDTVVVDALGLAAACGNVRAANVVLLGALACRLPIREELWQESLAAQVPAHLLEVNRAAFAAGYEMC